MKRITKIEAAGVKAKKNLRVAAYARVSTSSEEQLVSLETQKTHYESFIKAHRDWEYAGLYYDEGITGTKMAKRDGLLNMLSDCEAGKIDHIVVKSISRFSRNTLDTIETVRHLTDIGVSIFFEKENIDTAKMEGELLLSILSSLAESESRSISDNSTWSIQKRFQQGKFSVGTPPYGYRVKDGVFTIDEERAETVRFIFREMLSGNTPTKIATALRRNGVPTARGGRWSDGVVRGIIRNEKYVGDVLLQKTYTDSSFNRHMNNGEKDKYYVKDHHEPIISREDFEKANALVDASADRRNIQKGTKQCQVHYPFSEKIICGECGSRWKHGIVNGIPAYICQGHVKDKNSCGMLSIREDAIEAAFTTMMNKLIFSRSRLLVPYSKAYKNQGKEKDIARILEIEKEMEENISRKESVGRFFTKGLLDPAVYTEQMDGLNLSYGRLSEEKTSLTRDMNGGYDRQANIAALMKATAGGKMLTDFDEELFTAHVDHIVIYSRTDIGFVMKCGPEFRERMDYYDNARLRNRKRNSEDQ